jgi:DNA-binding CsgD family transcriptional regulator
MLLERDQDLAALAARIGALHGSHKGGAVLIEGPPGIGKSALLAAATARPPDAVQVLRARGSELEAGLAFGGVRQLLAPVLRRLSQAEREALLSGPAALAAPALALGPAPAGGGLSDPLYGLYWLAADLAERTPLVLAIDDLHWLDEESARFVAYLAPRLEGIPLLVLATVRPEEPGAGDIALADLAAAGEVLRPAPLSPAAIAEMVPGRPADAVRAATGGNPLLVAELARSDPKAALEEVAPGSVGRSVLRRVERISPDAVALARAVSLFAAGATLADAATVAGIAADAAADAADRLFAASVLAGGDVVSFAHPLMRAAVYEELGPHARRAGHAQAAAVLRGRAAPVEEVAAHLLAGAPSGDPADVATLREAAARALAAAAPRAALRYLERALAEPLPAGPERLALLRDAGRLQAMLGHADAEATLTRALELASLAGERVDIALELAAVRHGREEFAAAVGLLAPLVGAAELDPERTLILDAMLAGCAVMAPGHAETFRAAVDRIPDDLRGDTPGQRFALMWKTFGSMSAGRPMAKVLAMLQPALDADAPRLYEDLGSEVEDPITVLTACGELDLVEALAEERMERAQEIGAEAAHVAAQAQAAAARHLRGHWHDAESLLRAILEHPATGRALRTWGESALTETLVMQDRLDEAEAVLATMPPGIMTEVRRAQLGDARGDHSLYPAFKQAADQYASRGLTSAASTRWLCPYALGLGQAGRTAEAITLMEKYLASAQASGERASIGEARIVLGQLLDGPDAIAHLDAACATLTRSPFDWLLARARLEHGSALRRAGQRLRSRELLRSALDYAVRHGDADIARRARDELHVTGARLRNVYLSGAESLTPAELRIARLAADGLTNREIAQRLFLTRKTVEMHMSRCLRKLDISSRKDLPAAIGAGSV